MHAKKNLQTADLISYILEVISNKTFLFAHTTYIFVLSNYMLPVAKYRNNITRGQWHELLKYCIKCYKDPSPDVRKEKVLEAIQLIVKYGCSLSQLTVRIRKLIPFLGKYFKF